MNCNYKNQTFSHLAVSIYAIITQCNPKFKFYASINAFFIFMHLYMHISHLCTSRRIKREQRSLFGFISLSSSTNSCHSPLECRLRTGNICVGFASSNTLFGALFCRLRTGHINFLRPMRILSQHGNSIF